MNAAPAGQVSPDRPWFPNRTFHDMPRFSDTVMAHFEAPSNRGRLQQPDGVGLVGTPGAGPFFLLGLNVACGRVTAARFECHGCGAFVACGSVLTELVIGRDVDGCMAISQLELTEALDGLPSDKQHCLDTALHALRQALAEAAASQGAV